MKLKEIRKEERLEFKEKTGEVCVIFYAVNHVKYGWDFIKWLREKDKEVNDFSVEITSSFSPGNSHDEDPEWHTHIWKENLSFQGYTRKASSQEEIDGIKGCRRADCLFQGKQIVIYCKYNALIIKFSKEDSVNIQEMEEQLRLNEAVDWETHLYNEFFKSRRKRDWWIDRVIHMDTSDLWLMR